MVSHSFSCAFFLFSQVSAATPREEVVEAIRLKLMAVTEFSS